MRPCGDSRLRLSIERSSIHVRTIASRTLLEHHERIRHRARMRASLWKSGALSAALSERNQSGLQSLWSYFLSQRSFPQADSRNGNCQGTRASGGGPRDSFPHCGNL